MMDQDLIRKVAETMHAQLLDATRKALVPIPAQFDCEWNALTEQARLIFRLLAMAAMNVFYEHTGKQKSEARSQESE
jgi:hypothetical protein